MTEPNYALMEEEARQLAQNTQNLIYERLAAQGDCEASADLLRWLVNETAEQPLTSKNPQCKTCHGAAFEQLPPVPEEIDPHDKPIPYSICRECGGFEYDPHPVATTVYADYGAEKYRNPAKWPEKPQELSTLRDAVRVLDPAPLPPSEPEVDWYEEAEAYSRQAVKNVVTGACNGYC